MNRVYLRAFEIDDYKKLNEIRNKPEIMLYTGGNKFFISSEYDKKWVEDKIFNNKTQLYLVICLTENNELIGYLSIIEIDFQNRKAEWGGIIIAPEFSGKGYATESANLMLAHAFNELDINRFWGYWLESNQASIRMSEKLGFKKEGLLRDFVYKNGKQNNVYIMSILKSEFFDNENK